MKKIFGYILAASAVFAAASCTQQLEGPATDQELVPMTITVNGEMTKTLVGEDGKTINWCEDDVIAIFDGVAKREFTVVTADGKNATFAGEVAPGATELYAVYPYSAAVECVNGVVTASLAAEQQLDGGNVADGAIVAVGQVAADASVQFKNAVGFLRVDVSYDDVTEIIVNGSDIAGSAFIAATGEVDKVADAASSVSLKPAGEKFAPGSYYVTLFPGVTSAGKFSVTLVRADKGLTMTAANEITVPRNAGFFVTDTKLSETYIIKDAASLQTFLASAADCLEDESATVIKDIDLTGVTLTPADSYAGTFNGNGHSLKNWTSNNTLFTTLAATGTVKDLIIDQSCTLSFPSDKKYFGFVVGDNAGTVSGIENYADVTIPALPTVANYHGTICGNNTATVADCANFGNITYNGGVPTQNACYGGVVGQITGAAAVARNLFNSGDVTATINGVAAKSVYWNGVLGWLGNNAKLLESINYGNVTVRAHGNSQMLTACGLVSYAGGDVSGCYNGGDISYFAESAEGLADGGVQRTGVCGIAAYIGWAGKTVANNENEGNITFRAGYSLGYGGCGSTFSKYAVNVAGVFAAACNCAIKECKNSGEINFTMTDIDNASSFDYINDKVKNAARQSCGGVVASSWGKLTDCENTGDVNIIFTTVKPQEGVALSGWNGKGVGYQFGGISGGDYHSSQDKSPIEGCTNSGDIHIITNATAYNNNAGGIVGWPAKGGATIDIANCVNSGNVTVEGASLVRFGGIAGASAMIKSCTNSGAVTLTGANANSVLGGIVGYVDAGDAVTSCISTGAVTSAVKLAGAQGGYQGGIGGVFGAAGNNNGIYIDGNYVKADITAPAGSTAYLVAGVVGQNKAVTSKITFGTEENPTVIGGGSLTLGTTKTVVTASNFNTLALPWDTNKTNEENALPNVNISYVVKFAE